MLSPQYRNDTCRLGTLKYHEPSRHDKTNYIFQSLHLSGISINQSKFGRRTGCTFRSLSCDSRLKPFAPVLPREITSDRWWRGLARAAYSDVTDVSSPESQGHYTRSAFLSC